MSSSPPSSPASRSSSSRHASTGSPPAWSGICRATYGGQWACSCARWPPPPTRICLMATSATSSTRPTPSTSPATAAPPRTSTSPWPRFARSPRGSLPRFGIRPFLDLFPGQVLATLQVWTEDAHYHVRRLCSEGTRPRLPWALSLTLPHDVGIPLLDRLFADPTRYVTRSVANHVNDISKKDPELALDTLERWRSSGLQHQREMGYVIRHAARTLVRAGHPRAVDLDNSSLVMGRSGARRQQPSK